MRQYEGVLAQIQPVVKPLLRPHLMDMEQKLAPGMFVLTWTSMNIDGYLHRWAWLAALLIVLYPTQRLGYR